MTDPALSDIVRLSKLIPDLPLARNTIYARAKAGRIPSAHQTEDGEWFVSRRAIEAWLIGPKDAPRCATPAPPVPTRIADDLPAMRDLPETEALKALRRRLARPGALDRRVIRDDQIGFADPFGAERTVTPEQREQLWSAWLQALVGLRTLPDDPRVVVLVESFERLVEALNDDRFW